jgi:hypothetical protein
VVTEWYALSRQVAVIDQAFTSSSKGKVNEAQSVGFHVSWEHDGTDVADASVYVNGTEHITNTTGWVSFNVAYDSVGNRSWNVTGFEHPEAISYKVSVESPHIVWDEVVVNVEIDSASFGVSEVRVEVAQAYEGDSVTGVTTTVNGKICEEIEPGVYEVEIDSWSPYQQITVENDLPELAGETWTTSTFHVMNIILYIALVASVIVTIFVFLKLRKRSSTQPSYQTE